MNHETTQETKLSFEVKNPRTGETLYTATEPTIEEVDAMYETADAALEQLRSMSVRQRLDELLKIKGYLLDHGEEVAQRIVAETGKCITDAIITEIFPVLDTIEYYHKHAERMLRDKRAHTPIMLLGKKSRVVYEPMGTVLIISPWNYPLNLSVLPFICAFVAGNAVILKPSKETPLQGVLEEMIEKSGFMPGALQVAYASRRTADLLIDKKPAKIFFTGSVNAGKKVMARAAEMLIPVELELGGKDPMIIFDDANLERAVNGALWGSFVNSGQTCTSIERIYVHKNIYEPFMALFKEKAERIVTLNHPEGQADEYALTMGCMTADFQIREIEEQLAASVQQGARIVTGGKRAPGSHAFPPTIITNVTRDMPIQCRESFGPVVTVTPFKDEEEAVRLANDSVFGLSASVWSADMGRAWRVAQRLVTGNVSINNALATQGNPALPFGGVKDSGFGRYKGAEGLYAFSNIKSILADRNNSRLELYWYPYSRKKYTLFRAAFDALFRGGPLSLFKAAITALKLERCARKDRL